MENDLYLPLYQWFRQHLKHAIAESDAKLYAAKLIDSKITNIDRLRKAFDKKSHVLETIFDEFDLEDVKVAVTGAQADRSNIETEGQKDILLTEKVTGRTPRTNHAVAPYNIVAP